MPGLRQEAIRRDSAPQPPGSRRTSDTREHHRASSDREVLWSMREDSHAEARSFGSGDRQEPNGHKADEFDQLLAHRVQDAGGGHTRIFEIAPQAASGG